MHFAFNPARANIGSIGMWNSKMIGCISPIYSVFEVEKDYEIFINYYLKMDSVKEEIIKRSSGSVRQNLSFEEFSNIKIPEISPKDIKEFNKITIPLWNQLNENNRKIERLKLIKNKLLMKYFK